MCAVYHLFDMPELYICLFDLLRYRSSSSVLLLSPNSVTVSIDAEDQSMLFAFEPEMALVCDWKQ